MFACRLRPSVLIGSFRANRRGKAVRTHAVCRTGFLFWDFHRRHSLRFARRMLRSKLALQRQMWNVGWQKHTVLAFGFLQNCGLVSADFVHRIPYLLYGEIFSGVLSKPIALFLQEWKMKWSSSKRDGKQDFSDAHVIQDISWMAVLYVSVHNGMSPGHLCGIRNQRGGRCCFASPWYLVLSSVNDSGQEEAESGAGR